MNPQEITALVSALQVIAKVLDSLGVPGLLGLALSGPAVVLVTILFLDHFRGARMEKMQKEFRDATSLLVETHRKDSSGNLEAYRKDTARIIEANRADTVQLLEAYRKDTQGACLALGRDHAEVTKYYQDNVQLVTAYERVADSLQTVVVSNTRAMEGLAVIVKERTLRLRSEHHE